MKFCPECASRLEEKTIHGIERKVCSASSCGFVHWGNPVPVVAALVQYQDQLLLARNKNWPSDPFSLITGFLEPVETPEQAVLREVKEELGLDAELSGFIGHYAFIRMNQLILAFAVRATGVLRLGDEIVEVRRVSREQLKKYEFGRLALTAEIVRAWLEKTSPPQDVR